MLSVKRLEENPILSPNPDHPWEAESAFNWCPVKDGKNTHVVYRAVSDPELMDQTHIRISVIGHAKTKDGAHFDDRRAFITPEKDWEKYGCEDPRVTKLGGKFYIFYTALSRYPFSADGIKVAVAITKDFKKIEEKHLVTPFNAKAMALFPKKINGKFAALLTAHTDLPPARIAYAEFEKEEDMWSTEYWDDWHKNLENHRLEVRRSPHDHVELGAPPIETRLGWLVIYSHIQNYFGGEKVFGIEALLLDLKNPRKVIGRTTWPLMVPETPYEKFGVVPNIVFPSGAIIEGEDLHIYYGSADTQGCIAKVNLENLLQVMTVPGWRKYLKRLPNNPVISPRPGKKWEAKGTFNPAVVDVGGMVHILYRAVSDDNVSTIGYAMSKDGYSIDERLSGPIYIPREDFEKRRGGSGNGCEDPRVIELGDRIYMTYTAYDGVMPRVAITSIKTSDFLKKNWVWEKPTLITPPNVEDKDCAIFPEAFNKKYLVIHRVHNSVCADFVPSLDFKKEIIDQCIEMLSPRQGMWDANKVGIAAPPIKTRKGWLTLYHGVSGNWVYRVGALLLDKKNPTEILARSVVPLLEPSEEYEKSGVVPNVVFPCGAVIRDKDLIIYYGAADCTIGIASVPVNVVIKMLE